MEAGAPRELVLCAPRDKPCPSSRYCGRYVILEESEKFKVQSLKTERERSFV
jgi:hypothetical protein